MGLVVDPYRFAAAAAFDPLSLSWVHAFWAEDPDWTPPSDGSSVTSWRNAGSNGTALAEATNPPRYRSSHAGLNNKPAIDSDGAGYMGHTNGSISQPHTIVVVGRFPAAQVTTLYSGAVTAEARIAVADLAADYRLYTTSVVDAGTPDTLGHLFVARYNGASSTLNVDGSTVVSGNPGSSAYGGVKLFASIANTQKGGVASFVGAISGSLSSGDEADLLAWSQDYYGTP